jgi:hypothetical protein
MARSVDPSGSRTLGVLTKLDLMDPGTDAVAMLKNEIIPLKHGYVGVVCRGQKEISSASGSSIASGLEKERAFFSRQSSVYGERNEAVEGGDSCDSTSSSSCSRKMATAAATTELASRCGIPSLLSILQALLLSKLKEALPSVKANVTRRSADCERELASLSVFPTHKGQRQKLIISATQRLVKGIESSVNNNGLSSLSSLSSQHQLYYVKKRANDAFGSFKNEVVGSGPNFTSPSFTTKLALSMSACRGRELPGFGGSEVFYIFMASEVARWKEPALKAVEEVSAMAESVGKHLCSTMLLSVSEMNRTPNSGSASSSSNDGAEASSSISSSSAQSSSSAAAAVSINALLIQEFEGIVTQVCKNGAEEARDSVAEFLENESNPYTLSECLVEEVDRWRLKLFNGAMSEACTSSRCRSEIEEKIMSWYVKNQGIDVHSNAVDMTGVLAAYWGVGAKRFIDNVCMACQRLIVRNMALAVQEKCYGLVEDASVMKRVFEAGGRAAEERKEQLERELKVLKTAEAVLDAYTS